MLIKNRLILGFSVSLLNNAFAYSPQGLWQTIDDKTQKPRSLVTLVFKDNQLQGRIIKVYQQQGDTGLCRKCPDKFKDKPIIGLTFLWGLKKASEDNWQDGQVLDPKSGHIYRAKLTMLEKGEKLNIRGYLGIPLFGRSQIWNRLPKSKQKQVG